MDVSWAFSALLAGMPLGRLFWSVACCCTLTMRIVIVLLIHSHLSIHHSTYPFTSSLVRPSFHRSITTSHHPSTRLLHHLTGPTTAPRLRSPVHWSVRHSRDPSPLYPSIHHVPKTVHSSIHHSTYPSTISLPTIRLITNPPSRHAALVFFVLPAPLSTQPCVLTSIKHSCVRIQTKHTFRSKRNGFISKCPSPGFKLYRSTSSGS